MALRKQQAPVLTWQGKTRETCRDVLPLTYRAFFGERPDGGWDNLVVHAENRHLLSTLAQGPLRRLVNQAGGIKLVYIDPPFAVGADFCAETGGVSALAYRDTWEGGIGAFLSMMLERLLLIRELLAEDGSIYAHCDYRTEPYMRLLLEEVFGRGRFLGSIIWHYTGGGRAKRWFSRKHDTIFHFARSNRWIFNADAVRVPYKPTSGYAKGGIVSATGKRYMPHPDGTPADDVWDIPMINPLSAERTGYPTQKPEALLERILLASSRPGDLVADFFCGSGTTAVVAQRLGRRFLCVDSSGLAIGVVMRRLLASSSTDPPFALATLRETLPSHAGEREEVFRHEAHLPGGVVRYTVSDIALHAETAGKGICLELKGFTVTVEGAQAKSGRKSRQAASDAAGGDELPGDWTGWLESWAVGVLCGNERLPEGAVAGRWCNRTVWHSRPSRGTLALHTGELAPPARPRYGSSGCAYIVTIEDIFANFCRVRVDV